MTATTAVEALTQQEENDLRELVSSSGGVDGAARILGVSDYALLSVLAKVSRDTTLEFVRTKLALRGAA